MVKSLCFSGLKEASGLICLTGLLPYSLKKEFQRFCFKLCRYALLLSFVLFIAQILQKKTANPLFNLPNSLTHVFLAGKISKCAAIQILFFSARLKVFSCYIYTYILLFFKRE